MRPKIVIVILLLAAVVLGAVIFLSQSMSHTAGGDAPKTLPTAQIETNPAPANAREPSFATATPLVVTNDLATAVVPQNNSETNHAVLVQERVAELMALAMNDDSNSLNTIWSELANPDKDIRAGALAAVVQFGDRSVAPRLRDLAAQTEDAAEKVEIINAADFLELPPLTEIHRVQSTNGPQ